MLHTSLAPYLLWAKTRHPAAIDLAGSNLLHCTIDELPGAREALDLWAPNDNGFAPIVSAIASHYHVDPARVVQGGGCSGANFITMAALVGAGDDVLVERPTYDPLIGAARLMGANIVRFERRASNGFRVDPDDVRRAVTPRTKVIVLTTPHNPSGVQIDRADDRGDRAHRVGARCACARRRGVSRRRVPRGRTAGGVAIGCEIRRPDCRDVESDEVVRSGRPAVRLGDRPDRDGRASAPYARCRRQCRKRTGRSSGGAGLVAAAVSWRRAPERCCPATSPARARFSPRIHSSNFPSRRRVLSCSRGSQAKRTPRRSCRRCWTSTASPSPRGAFSRRRLIFA